MNMYQLGVLVAVIASVNAIDNGKGKTPVSSVCIFVSFTLLFSPWDGEVGICSVPMSIKR